MVLWIWGGCGVGDVGVGVILVTLYVVDLGFDRVNPNGGKHGGLTGGGGHVKMIGLKT